MCVYMHSIDILLLPRQTEQPQATTTGNFMKIYNSVPPKIFNGTDDYKQIKQFLEFQADEMTFH